MKLEILIMEKKISKVMSPIFRETPDCIHNKACDALIFKEKSNNELDIFYIDLKIYFNIRVIYYIIMTRKKYLK